MAKQVRVCAVYAITHKASGKAYIGASVNVAGRWREWRWGLRGQYGVTGKALMADWKRDGEAAFRFELLETGLTREVLSAREQYWLDTTENLYNARRRSYPKLWSR